MATKRLTAKQKAEAAEAAKAASNIEPTEAVAAKPLTTEEAIPASDYDYEAEAAYKPLDEPAKTGVPLALDIIVAVKLELECTTVGVPKGNGTGMVHQPIADVNPRVHRAFEQLDNADVLIRTALGQVAISRYDLLVEVLNENEESEHITVAQLPVPMRLGQLASAIKEAQALLPVSESVLLDLANVDLSHAHALLVYANK